MTVLQDLFAGSMGGAVGCVFGHPLDTCKVRMQIDPALTLRRTVKTILRTEGAKGLFKGLAPPLLSVCVYQGVCFASFQPALDIVQSVNASSRASSSASSASAGELFVAGSISGAATVVVTTPTDLLKIRLQVSSGGGGIAAMSVAAREIFAKQGIRGFYRGAVATLMRDTFSTGLYFCVYHEMKREMKRAEYNGVAGELMAGGIAGMLAWGSCLPCDVVKTRIQGGEKGMKWLPTFVKIYQESPKRLFAGALPLLSRAFFVNGLTFFAYEETLRYIK